MKQLAARQDEIKDFNDFLLGQRRSFDTCRTRTISCIGPFFNLQLDRNCIRISNRNFGRNYMEFKSSNKKKNKKEKMIF